MFIMPAHRHIMLTLFSAQAPSGATAGKQKKLVTAGQLYESKCYST